MLIIQRLTKYKYNDDKALNFSKLMTNENPLSSIHFNVISSYRKIFLLRVTLRGPTHLKFLKKNIFYHAENYLISKLLTFSEY